MAEQLPQIIPRGQSSAVASYDFVDLASGAGYELFYAISQAGTNGGAPSINDQRFLSSEALRSGFRYTTRSGAAEDFLIFDTNTFNLPRTVKGTAILNGDFFSTTTEPKRLRVLIQKVAADATVTDLSSTINSNSGNVLANINTYFVQIPLTQTIIKKGERLRLKIFMTIDSGTGNFEIGHDGANRNGSDINLTTYPQATTQMKLYIPFRVDTT